MKTKITLSNYEFIAKFPDETAARTYLEQQRWNGKTVCPHCSSGDRIQVRKVAGYFRCLACKEDFTVRTGTIFERSHIPLDKWLYAMYLVATARKGVSSMQISKELGITQKSAWFMLQRIREACGNDPIGGGFLSGVVEVDESYFGGREANKHTNKKSGIHGGPGAKHGVLGLRERGGRTKAVVIDQDTSKARLLHELRANIEAGSTVCTDDAPAYHGMKGFTHLSVNHSAKEYVNGMASTNGIESVWALVKRGYYGIYHQFTLKHLQRYVDEFTYRLNEGNCKIHTMDRIDSLIDKAPGARITYKALTKAA